VLAIGTVLQKFAHATAAASIMLLCATANDWLDALCTTRLHALPVSSVVSLCYTRVLLLRVLYLKWMQSDDGAAATTATASTALAISAIGLASAVAAAITTTAVASTATTTAAAAAAKLSQYSRRGSHAHVPTAMHRRA
jgi:hypothetical protein